MRVYTNDTDTVVAFDLEDARRVVEAHYGFTFEQEGWTIDDWSEVPGDQLIAINDVLVDHVATKVTLTAAEWAARDGRCFLCSTEY